MSTHVPSPRSASGRPRELLSQDHVRIERLFTELLGAFATGDREAIASEWTRFDEALRAHLDAEEMHILPLFRAVDVDEAARIAEDHAYFRGKLGELAVCVDLHVVSLPMATEFVDRLRAHAAREDALMYRWADTHLEHPASTSIGEKLASLRPAVSLQ
jgi:hemerythrin-like domain-containing protein